MSETHVTEGPNFVAVLHDALAEIRVWRRADLSLLEGAQCAEMMLEAIHTFASLPADQAAGLILDLSEAPPVMGPKTQALMREMYQTWSATERPCATIVSQHPVQLMQHERLAADHDPARYVRFYDRDQAINHLQGGQGERASSGVRYEKLQLPTDP